jgi:hypothetical protein
MVCRDSEIKQLQGWKATVENLLERMEDMLRQTSLLADIEAQDARMKGALAASSTSSAAAAAAAAAAAGDVETGDGGGEEGPLGGLAGAVNRGSIITTQHTLQLNKLRCGGLWSVECSAGGHLWGMACGLPA